MAEFDYDLFVIGAGSGGVRAARIAAGHGAKAAVAEEYRAGGTCVIRGCVPKKLLVYASRFRDEFEDAVGFGWGGLSPKHDWPTLIARKDAEIARLEHLYEGLLERSGVALFKERATVDGPNAVRLAGGRRVTARILLVAAGGHPERPAVPGAELAITSNEAFQLGRRPASIAIVGGGYIGIEFACIFKGLGADVRMFIRGGQILRGFDDELRELLAGELHARGIRITSGCAPVELSMAGPRKRLSFADGTAVDADEVMFATGRTPNTKGLGLETVGVKLGRNGEIAVDAWSRSSEPSIYAVGDVTDRMNLTPVAIREGHAFADTVFGGKPASVDNDVVPTAVFSTPELGTVGLNETQARGKHGEVDAYVARFRPLKATLSEREERMFMKLLVEPASQRVVGLQILGADAAEIVQMAAIAIRMGATKADFDATMALHPSAAEELVTMREKRRPAATPFT